MNLDQQLERDFPALYAHPNGSELCFNTKTSEIELHAEHDQCLSIPVGFLGLKEISKAAKECAKQIEPRAGKPEPKALSAYARALLGLEFTPMNSAVDKALRNRFDSLPYAQRLDADCVAEHFALVQQLVKAADRAESIRTVCGNSDLTLQISETIELLKRFLPA